MRINTGEFDPIANRTYQEQAWIGFNNHKTQAMGFIPEKERFYYYYAPATSLVPVSEGKKSDFYEGLDSTLTGLADYPGGGAQELRDKLEAIKEKAKTALAQFRADDSAQAGFSLLDGGALLRRLRAGLANEPLAEEVRHALASYLGRKQRDFEETAARCLGFELECLANYAHITPRQQFRVTTRLWNPRHIFIRRAEFGFDVLNRLRSRALGRRPTLVPLPGGILQSPRAHGGSRKTAAGPLRHDDGGDHVASGL